MDPELRRRRRRIEAARSEGLAPDEQIDASWRRCRDLVEAGRDAAPVDCEPDEVRQRWEASPIRRSGVGVEEALTRAAEAGGLVAAVTDDEGRILWSAGSRQMRRAAEDVGFIPGGRWDEGSVGTNALGLALVTGAPAAVFSAEHWCDAVRDWACWSVPVRAPDGSRLGVLDLSGRWDEASSLAGLVVEGLGRLVEERVAVTMGPRPSGPTAPESRGLGHGHGHEDGPVLALDLLGHLRCTVGDRSVALSPRQAELLAALVLGGPATLDELQARVYGDRPVRPSTVKAELSHLRRLLGGAIASRPYRITLPVQADALEVGRLVRAGDLHGATVRYGGQLLPDSESPLVREQRHVLDVALRRSLLSAGTTAQLLRFAAVHRSDVEVLEVAVDRAAPSDPLRHESEARLRAALAT